MKHTQKVLASPQGSNNDELHHAICKDAAENLDANLVSIWRFEENNSKIICLHSYDVTTGEISKDQELLREQFPTYFEAILEETTICAPSARTHPLTKELAEAYFVPNEIESLLDFIVHKNFKPIGIICCESKRKRREWSEDDKSYLRSQANYASFRANVTNQDED